ncbi:MAG: membrane protein insertase YidC, partial [Nitrospirota bacterium]
MESFDKRTLIAVILALIVLIGYQFLLPFYTPEQPQNQDISSQKEMKDPVETAPVQSRIPKDRAVIKQAAVEPADEKEIKVETGLYTAVLTSKGGTIKRFELKNYRDNNGLGISLLNLQATTMPLAIGVSTDDFRLSDMNFSMKGTDLVLKAAQSGSVTFEYNSPPISIKRTYTFYADNYRFDLKDEVGGLNEYWMSLGTGFGINDINDESSQHTGPVLLKGTDRIELAATKLKEPRSFA